jgi:hypothetical protein
MDLGSDGINVWCSISPTFDAQGHITHNKTLKYSTRDQSWTVHEYSTFLICSLISGTPHLMGVGGVLPSGISAIVTDKTAATSGFPRNVYWMEMESGYTDGAFVAGETIVPGTTFNYYILTQDVEFGSRAHQKSLSDKMVVYVLNGASSSLFIVDSNGDYSYPIPASMVLPVTILADIQSSGFFFNFWWGGTSAEAVAVFQGLEIEEVTDEGINAGANSV